MPPTSFVPTPAVTPAQMTAIDRFMTDALGVDVIQLMELAGLAVARAAAAMLPGHDPRGRRILVLAGRGGNGGDGLVAARLLAAWGACPRVILSHPEIRLAPPAARNLASVRALGLPLDIPPDPPAAPLAAGIVDPAAIPLPLLPDADLIIDALLGFGLSGPPTGRTAGLIHAANAHPAPILAVDLPSGLDGTTGTPWDPCIAAARTITLALPKTGLLAPAARPLTGPITIGDIGIPPAAWASLAAGIDPGHLPRFSPSGLTDL
jgi:NAD(P)H-hydrate epimerase